MTMSHSGLLMAPTLWELIEARARHTPERTMLIDEAGRTVTFGEFHDRALRVAAALHTEGVGPGSRVAWQLPTRISTLLVMAALRRLGAVQAPIIPAYREREVTAAVATAGVNTILVPGTWHGTDFTAMATGLRPDGGPGPRVLVIGDDAPEKDDLGGLPRDPRDPGAVHWVYFTSGSTGAPKGARHCDDALLCAGAEFNRRSGLRADDVGAIAFPVAHIGGLCSLITMLCVGFPAVVMEAFAPVPAVELFRRHEVTFMGGSPVFFAVLLQMARARPGESLIPSLRLFKGGGAPCSEQLYRAVREELGVTIAHDYGMTEAPSITVASPGDTDEQLAHTEGRPIPGCDVRIVGSGGLPVPAGATGEVQLSGPIVCQGYTDEAETKAAFTPDGWFRTGDLGRLRSDGHLELLGRIKDLIIRKGENIAPQEIEELLSTRPDIAEAAVIGLPDPIAGERICAVITCPPGASPPHLAELSNWLADTGLMPQKRPEHLEIVTAMPRNPMGKIDKALLRTRFAGERLDY
ncbi:class I adenylate-forming enzyme family protein [Nonomuraea sp. H19]|uniref:class I adenylate-forming enzyme family protein n=1 Tax=Nonomuraea sp. H19 TaxID=3452206 RepID=UPI003F88AD52